MAFGKAKPAAAGPKPGDRFDGNHCFHEGFYYPVPVDQDGNEQGPDWDTKLVWDNHEGCLRHAAPDDPNHFHANATGGIVELTPAGAE